MTEDGSCGDRERQRSTVDDGAGPQQQKRGDQFDDAAPDPAPRLGIESSEDVNRLLGSAELEEQRLQHDDGSDDPESPACDGECFGLFHDRQFPSGLELFQYSDRVEERVAPGTGPHGR